MSTNYYYFLILCLFWSCKKDIEEQDNTVRNDDGVIINLNYEWKVDISDEKYAWSNAIPQLYENTVLIAGSKNDRSHYLKGIDLPTGEILYHWDKEKNPINVWFDNYIDNQKGEYVLFQDEDNSIYFNVESGEVKWQNNDPNMIMAYKSTIMGNNYYFTASHVTDSIEVPSLYKGSLDDGLTTILTYPDITKTQKFNNAYGTISPVLVFEKNNQEFAFYAYTENLDIYNNNSSFGYVDLYNITLDEYEYQNIKIGDILFLHIIERPLLINETVIVNASDELFGIDIKTGQTKWRKKDYLKNGEGTFSYTNYKQDFIGVNVGGFNTNITSINSESGAINWNITGEGGDAEQVFICEQYLFFTSRGDGKLYVYDLDNQELKIELESPDEESFQAYAGMRPFIIEDKLTLIISSYLNAYCYDLSFLLK